MINLARKGCSIIFKDNGYFEVMHDQDIVLSGHLVKGVMELDLHLGKSASENAMATNTHPDDMLHHRRLGHTGLRPFKKVYPNKIHPPNCDPCFMSKHHQLPYPGHFSIASGILDTIHSNLSGIISPALIGGGH